MKTTMSDDKTLADMLRDGQGTKLAECPWGCGNTHEVYETPEGVIDCYRCPPRMAKPTGETRLNYETLEVEPVKGLTPEQQESKEIREAFKEDGRRGEPGSSNSGGPSRKKPLKRVMVRWEQETPIFNNGRSGDIAIRRFETATEELKLRITPELLERVREEADSRYKEEGEVPLGSVVREAIRERCLHLGNVMPHVRGEEREVLQMRIFPSEMLALKEAAAYWEEPMNDVAVSCVREFLGEG